MHCTMSVSGNVCAAVLLVALFIDIEVTYRSGSIKSAANLTCVWCRAKWATPGTAFSSSSNGRVNAEGYINLAGIAGISPVRDTSSCESCLTCLKICSDTHFVDYRRRG